MLRKNFGTLIQYVRKHMSGNSKWKNRKNFAEYVEDLRVQKYSHIYPDHITPDVMQNIEQGRKELTPELIGILAQAFSISEYHKHNLYQAAGFHYDPKLPLDNVELNDFLVEIYLPVIIFNPVWDIRGMNAYYIKLHGMENIREHPGFHPNLLQHIFTSKRDDPMRNMEEWQIKAIWMFHTTALRYIYTERYKSLIVSLLENDEFVRGFSISLQRDFPEKGFWYPRHQVKYQGKTYEFMALRIPSQYFGNYELAIYVPMKTGWDEYMRFYETIKPKDVKIFNPPPLE